MRHIHVHSLIDRRQRRKLAGAQSRRRRLGRIGFGCGAFVMLMLVSALLIVGVAYTSLTAGLPSTRQLSGLLNPETGLLMQPTQLYDRSGQHLILSLENPGVPRHYLFLNPTRANHFSPELARVTVALLDPTFWQNPGFLPLNLLSPQPQTIAERLVSDLLLEQEEPGLRRSLRMRLLAAQLVHQYGRSQVLEWYLNSAYFGHLAYGVDSAARLYLNESAAQLDLADVALLLAAHEAPALNPLDAPLAAVERQRLVLDRLLAQGTITPQEHERAGARSLSFPTVTSESNLPAAAYAHLALDQLSVRFGRQRLERGGLRIITSLDYGLQLELVCLVRTQLAHLGASAKLASDLQLPNGQECQAARWLPALPADAQAYPSGLAASGVVLDPSNGQVLALLGDTSSDGQAQRMDAHAPGSLLSPFLAVASFARGYSPASLTWDIPVSSSAASGSAPSFDGRFHGPVRLRTALANDYLSVQAQLLAQMGAANVWRSAAALGLTSLTNETRPELLYGEGKVSPLELAQAYGVIATGGVRSGTRLIPGGDLLAVLTLEVEDLNGVPLLDARQSEAQPVLGQTLAYLIHNVLSDSSARAASLGYPDPLEIGRPAGAKVGQVNEGGQVWTAGYSKQRVALFWLGLPEGAQPAAPLDPRLSAGMWQAMMQYLHRDLPVEDWAEPAGISHVAVCDPSGQLPSAACPEVVNEVFLEGGEPTSADSLYQVYQINRETGRLATVFTSPVLIEEKTFLVAPPEARDWILSAGLPQPPKDYDAIQPAPTLPDVQIASPASFVFVRGIVDLRGVAAGEGFQFYQLQAGQGLYPDSWLQIPSAADGSVQNGLLGQWDTQGLQGLYAVRLMVVRQDQRVETAVIQVTVDNEAPNAQVTYPAEGDSFRYPQERAITFQAQASDAVGITRVVWTVDGQVVGESLQAPYLYTDYVAKGEHTLQVTAYDQAGNASPSEAVHFSLK